MFKSTIIAIILFMMSLTAGASPKVLTYEDFVHLSDTQKNEYIIKLMELTVELEDRYKKETAEHGYSKERFERYSKVLRTLKSIFLIDSAIAAPPAKNPDMSWKQLAVNFNNLMNTQRSTDGKTPDENCIFAGWVSRVVYITKNGKRTATCTHPDFIDGSDAKRHDTKMAPESKGYPDPKTASTCPLDDKNWIQCNPVIFGYKNSKKQSLFCVLASDGAHNSSYNCMQAALKDNADVDVDTKDQRLKDLRQRLSDPANKGVFQQVWDFTYKTCLCPTTQATSAGKKLFSQDYQNYMRPHRTCYGLMEMMGSTALECSEAVDKASPFPTTDTALFKELRSQIKRSDVKSEANADESYQNFLNSLKASNNADYLRVCKLQPETPQKSYSCTADCKTDASDKVSCSYAIKEMPADVDAQLDGDATGPEVKADTKEVQVKFKIKDSPDERSAKCEIKSISPKPVDNKQYTCSAECTMQKVIPGSEDDVSAAEAAADQLVCDYKIKDGDKDVETEGINGPTPKADVKEVEVKFKLKGATEEKTAKCALTYPVTPVTPKTDEELPKLTLEKKCADLTCDISAKWDETKFPGWEISWEITAPAGLTVPGASGKNAEKLPRAKDDYPVKAKITKAGKEAKAEDKVDKLAAAKPADKAPVRPMNYQNGLPQMPQPQIRGTSDTSAIGIK